MSKVGASVAAVLSVLLVSFASADVIVLVDYSQDTNNFFDTQDKRDAMQAVANRWGRIVQSSLSAVSPGGTGTGTSAGWRIGFPHPGTGNSFQVSTAANSGSDPLVGAGAQPANVYGFGGLSANTWIIYAGGRGNMGGAAGVGGTGTGSNFTETFTDPNGPFHRAVMPVSAVNPVQDIPVWGGSVSFNNTLTWHFDPATPAPTSAVDFYSIAMHELGHVLGLGTSWNQFKNFVTGSSFNGPNAVAAYNADNGTNLTSLNLVNTVDLHWQDGTYDSRIFAGGGPNYVGTVGAGNLQDLLMEPTANFTTSLRRFEATNVDVATLRDLGWSVVGVPELSTSLGLVTVLGFVGMAYSRRQRKQTEGAADQAPEDALPAGEVTPVVHSL